LKHPRPLVPDVSTNDPSVREDNQERFEIPEFFEFYDTGYGFFFQIGKSQKLMILKRLKLIQ